MGLFNNNGYTVIITAAKHLADLFDQGKFMGFFLLFMKLFSGLAHYIHGACFVRVKHLYRIMLVGSLMCIAYIMVAFACIKSEHPEMFWVAVFAAMIIGMA